jgi:hypothetical protein
LEQAVIPAHDEQSVLRAAQALRNGNITADYAPPAIAQLIEALLAERRAMRNELNDMEQQVYTHVALRTEYARGFRDAQAQMMQALPDEESVIDMLSPSYTAASEGARYLG